MKDTATTAAMWARVLEQRKARLRRLIELNAPDPIIYMAARMLLTAETHNSKWRAIWNWAADEWRQAWLGLKCDIGIWKLRRKGWHQACALGIYFGESPDLHKKSGCDCDREFTETLNAVLRREQR